jgi:hypothetical protein
MSLLKDVENAIHDLRIHEFTEQQLRLAYLHLHMDEPALHPDDCFFAESGYDGWMAVLVYFIRGRGPLPEYFEYPTHFLKLWDTLMLIQEFHEDRIAEGEDDIDVQKDLLTATQDLILWTGDIGLYSVENVMNLLEKLYFYHDFLEEDSDNPTSVLKACYITLDWLK